MMKILALLVSLLTATLCLADNGVSFYGSGHGVAGGGGSGMAATGSLQFQGSNANTGDWAITIPADAEMCVLSVSGYGGNTNGMTGDADDQVEICQNSGCGTGWVQDFTTSADYDASGTNQQVVIFTVAPSNTGSAYVNWDWEGSSPSDEGMNFYFKCYRNDTDDSTTISSQDGTQTTPFTATVTGNAGDIIVCAGDCYDNTASYAMDWTNATEEDSNLTNNNQGEFASNTDGTGETVSIADVHATYSAIACINIAD